MEDMMKKLQKQADDIRAKREALNLEARKLKDEARALSAELLEVERAIAEVNYIARVRNQKPGDVVMTVEPARLILNKS